MNTYNTQLKLGIIVWLLDLTVAYGMWLLGDRDIDISHLPTVANIALVACLYLLFLVGYLLSYGLFVKNADSKVKIAGLFMCSAAVLGLTAFFFFGMVALLAMIIIIQLVQYLDEKTALIVAILVPIIGVLFDVLMGKSFEYPLIIIYGTFNVLALITNYRLVSERKVRNELEQRVRELKATQILLSSSSKRDERLRISRDLHDVLGHQLTALSLQLEVASHVKEEEKNQHLLRAKAIGKTLLDDVRETVAEFRINKNFNLNEALQVLTQDLPELRVRLAIEADETAFEARQVEAIFRCVQEALTNIVKHSNADNCTISLAVEKQSIILRIKDNGQNIAPVEPGNGLTGMNERVVKLDGTLNWQPLEDGFSVTARFPMSV